MAKSRETREEYVAGNDGEMQQVENHADPHKYFSMIPNMVDDSDLDPYERTLYLHYARVGACFESTVNTAQKCHMSTGKVSEARQTLAKKGWISLSVSRYGTCEITIIDRWKENIAKYSPDEQRSPHERLVHHMNGSFTTRMARSPGETKKNQVQELIKEPVQEVVVAPLARDSHDHRAEKALEKAKAKPKAQPAPALETEFGAQFAAYEKEFFPIGHMSPSEANGFGELWDELTGPPASIPPDKVARTFEKARRELVEAIERERKKGRKMRPSAPLFKRFVYDIVREDFEWVEVEDDGAGQIAGQEGISGAEGRDVRADSGELNEDAPERVMRDAPSQSVSCVPRRRYYTTGPLSRIAAGTGAGGGDGE